jgi:two-component system sensor histidine kinase DctS
VYGTPYTLPRGVTAYDLVMPVFKGERFAGALVAVFSFDAILTHHVPWWFAEHYQLEVVDVWGHVLGAKSRLTIPEPRHSHAIPFDPPGHGLTLLATVHQGESNVARNILVVAIFALTVAALWSLWAVRRHIKRRIDAEQALRTEYAFRKAMEDSLTVGMRARDLDGRVTYANPAFCKMVGMQADQLLGKLPPMAYWAPEAMENYQLRFAQVLAGTVTPQGFETIFQRANGERFPVLIFESALLDATGKQTGWMGSILDITERKQAEDQNRRQLEQLQISARLASMGELASTLAHELNQPLAAISSYTTGALNLLNDPAAANGARDAMLKPALEKAAAQAQRAGQIIRSVHDFVKQRAPDRTTVSMRTILDSVEPLIALQAQPFFVKVHLRIAPQLPNVLADRVLIEQVLLNLTRNAIESMQQTPYERRILRIESASALTPTGHPAVVTSIIDLGHGIPEEVSEHLYSPFFSTKSQGMGMGLNICRTVIEFHGGTLTHADNPGGGTIFQFALPILVAEAAVPAAVL